MKKNLNHKVTTDIFPKVSTAILLLFCGYVFCRYLQIGYRVPVLGAIRFEFLYAGFLTAVILLKGEKVQWDKKLLTSVLLLFLVMVIQVPFSFDVAYSYEVFIDRVVKFSFLSFFIVSFVRSPRHMFFFIAAFLLACGKMGQEGLLGQITGHMVWENQGVMRLHGSTPIYGHPNSFSGMALGTIPFIIYLFPLANKWQKLVLAILFIFAANIIVHTGSRTGYVAFFILIFFMFLNSQNKKKALLILCAGLTLLISVIDVQYTERFNSIFTGKDKEGRSTEVRKEILSDSFEIFLEYPLGVGVSAFPTVRAMKFGRSQDTHNLYLEVATNLGIQGLIVFGFFIKTMISSLRRVQKTLRMFVDLGASRGGDLPFISKKELQFLLAITNAVLMFLVARLGLGLFGMDLYEIYWWFSFGLTAALCNMVKRLEIHNKKYKEGFYG